MLLICVEMHITGIKVERLLDIPINLFYSRPYDMHKIKQEGCYH
jgi:hypothetical protein